MPFPNHSPDFVPAQGHRRSQGSHTDGANQRPKSHLAPWAPVGPRAVNGLRSLVPKLTDFSPKIFPWLIKVNHG